jgi:hypothetical protein
MMIIIIGVGLFGTFTGYLANWFLSPSKKKALPEATTAEGSKDETGQAEPALSTGQ